MLTDQQTKAMRGELSLAEFETAAWSMWRLGYFKFDPLAEMCGRKTGLSLTEKGRRVAQSLRVEEQENG